VAIEGELTVRLDWDGRRVRRVTVRSTRPFAAARVLVGRTVDEAAAMVPRLFSVCAHAQGAAAAGAVEAAAGRVRAPGTHAAREAAVLLETVQEYLRRILLDWPQAMGHDAPAEPVARARRLIAPVLARLASFAQRTDGSAPNAPDAVPGEVASELALLAARNVYGSSPEAWLAAGAGDALAGWIERAPTLPARLLNELRATARTLGRSNVPLMPSPRRDALLAAVVPAMRADSGFERTPTWEGVPVETGALARTSAHPLVAAFRARDGNTVPARMVARLTELAMLVGGLSGAGAQGEDARWVDAVALAPGEGLAAVQTARSLLLHRASVADAHVTGYQIVAPTEWNFHPGGPLVRGLEGAGALDEAALVRHALLAVQALDPCVRCQVEVASA